MEEADTTTEAWAEAMEEEATIEAAATEEDAAPEVVEEATTMMARKQWEEEADQEVHTSQVIVTEAVNHKAQQQWSTGEHAVATAQTALQRMEAIDELCANQKLIYLIVKLNHNSSISISQAYLQPLHSLQELKKITLKNGI